MQETEQWLGKLLNEEEDPDKIVKAVKERILESYRNGKESAKGNAVHKDVFTAVKNVFERELANLQKQFAGKQEATQKEPTTQRRRPS